MQLVCPGCLKANRVPDGRLADGPVCGKCRASLLPSTPLALTDATFDRYAGGSDMPVLVDFWADWCAPCRQMAPVLDELARRRPDVRVAKVDTASSALLPQRLQIRSIPTLVLLRRGVEMARMSGAVPTPRLESWLDGELRRMPPREFGT